MNLVPIAVVGAHLRGQPLNHQLSSRGAHFVKQSRTAACYRLYALVGTVPPKPGLARVSEGGAGIEVEVWEMDLTAFGSFVSEVPPPMVIGTIELESGESVKGFLCEPFAIEGAKEITEFGGWKAYLAAVG